MNFNSNQIGKKFSLGSVEIYQNPVSDLCSEKNVPQEKLSKIFGFFGNIEETEKQNKNRFPKRDAPGNRAFSGTFGFRNNPPYAEKSVPKCRWENWKFWF